MPRKFSEEALENIRRAVRKSWENPTIRQNRIEAVSRAKSGRIASPEENAKRSLALKKHYSGQTDEEKKFRARGLRAFDKAPRTKERIEKQRASLKATLKQSSELTIRNSLARKAYWHSLSEKEKIERGKKLAANGQRKKSNTSLELAVRKELDRLEIPYKQNSYLLGFYPDFAIKDSTLLIECDGTFWHGMPDRILYDRKRDAKLAEHGYQVVRLTEDEIKKNPVKAVSRALQKLA